MSKMAPVHRGQPQTRARLDLVEALLNERPMHADQARGALFTRHGIDVSIGTARDYLVALRTEGRATSRRITSAATRTGVVLFVGLATPAAEVEKAVREIEARPAPQPGNLTKSFKRSA
jgi:hypothetical protein